MQLSPSEVSRGETTSTLQFADRAKKVTVHAYANEELATGNELIKANHEIQRLRDMLRSLGGGLIMSGSNGGGSDDVSHLRRVTLELQAERKRRREVEMELTSLRQQYLTFTNDTVRGRGAVKPLVDRLRQTEKKSKPNKTPLSKSAKGGGGGGNSTAATAEHKVKLDMQRAWNRVYINWLKKCPGVVSEGGGNTVTRPNQLTPRQAKLLNPSQRVTLAEWSLLLQTEELERTKILLLEEREHFRTKIEHKMEQNPNTTLRWSESPGAEMPILSQQRSPSSPTASVTSQMSLLSSDPGMSVTPIERGGRKFRNERNHRNHRNQKKDDREEEKDDEGEDIDDEDFMTHVEENDEEVGESAVIAVRGMLARMKKIDERARMDRMQQEKLDEELRDARDDINSMDDMGNMGNMGNRNGRTADPKILQGQESVAAFMNQENDKPSTLSSEPKRMLLWKKIFDSNSGHNYYYNRATGASVWERPSDFFVAVVPSEIAQRLGKK